MSMSNCQQIKCQSDNFFLITANLLCQRVYTQPQARPVVISP